MTVRSTASACVRVQPVARMIVCSFRFQDTTFTFSTTPCSLVVAPPEESSEEQSSGQVLYSVQYFEEVTKASKQQAIVMIERIYFCLI